MFSWAFVNFLSHKDILFVRQKRMKSGDNKMSDFGKNYLGAGAVRLVNVVISYRFEHLFFQTYFMQGGTCGGRYKIINFLISPTEGGFCYFEFYYLMNSWWGLSVRKAETSILVQIKLINRPSVKSNSKTLLTLNIRKQADISKVFIWWIQVWWFREISSGAQ